MGFIDDKSNIFNEVAVNRALRENFPELNRTISLFNSVKSKEGNLIPFLLDLFVEIGDKSLKEDVFKPILEKSVTWEKSIKDTLVENITNFYVKNNFSLSGLTQPVLDVKIKNIDPKGTLKIDENSDIGKFYYGENQEQLFNEVNNVIPNTPTVEFNSNIGGNFTLFLRKVMKTGSGKWKDLFLFEYDVNTEKLKVNLLDTNTTFEAFIKKSLNSIKLLDLSTLFSNIIDVVFGTVSSLTDIGEGYIEDLLKSKELINKIINKETLSETEFNTYDDSFFVFTKEEQDNIRSKKEAIINGNNLVNLGCGQGRTFVDFDGFSESFDNINNFRPNLVKKSFSNFIDNLTKDSTANLPDEDKESSLIKIIKEFIDSLIVVIFQQVTQPFVTMILQFIESILNDFGLGVNLTNPNSSLEVGGIESFIINFREQSTCIIKKIYSLIVEYLFNIIKSEILNLVATKISRIIKEKSLQYRAQVERARELLQGINNILSLINGGT